MYGIDLEVKDNNWNGEGLPSVGQMVKVDRYKDPVTIRLIGIHSKGFI
jgi:hypothetical protein